MVPRSLPSADRGVSTTSTSPVYWSRFCCNWRSPAEIMTVARILPGFGWSTFWYPASNPIPSTASGLTSASRMASVRYASAFFGSGSAMVRRTDCSSRSRGADLYRLF